MKNMKIFLGAAFFTLLATLPLFLGRYHMYVVNLVGISILLALDETEVLGEAQERAVFCAKRAHLDGRLLPLHKKDFRKRKKK